MRLDGSGFTGATAVRFGTTAAASFSVFSDNEIDAVAPAGTSVVDVIVTTPSGTSPTGAGDRFGYGVGVSSISPSGGSPAGGTVVTIQGIGLTGVTGVNFGSTPAASFTVVDDTQVTTTAPAGTGIVDVMVATPHGTTGAGLLDKFTYVTEPATVTAISPTSGTFKGGQQVYIYGSGFLGANGVSFGNTAASYFYINDDVQITTVAPAGTGAVDVTVRNEVGASATSAADRFTYITGPTVTYVAPAAGPSSGGNAVSIVGSGFTGATRVNFGGVVIPASGLTDGSDTFINLTVPAGSTGTVDVTVTTPNGTSAITPGDRYTYEAAPAVTGLSPNQGPMAGGNTVTITGTNFIGARLAFGTISDDYYTVVDGSHIVASVPSGTGVVDVRVTTPSGTSAINAGDRYTYAPTPAVTSISPSFGPAAGGTTVTITGTGLSNAAAVAFGGVTATITANTDTQITATAPAGTGTVDISVITIGGTSAASAADQYLYVEPPAVAAVAPANGPATGGNMVTISGLNFGGTTAVDFGAAAATSFSIQSATQITAVAPAGTLGTVDVTVTSPGGTSATSTADQFTYTASVAGQVYTYQSTLGVPGISAADNTHYNNPSPGAVDTVNSHLLIADTANDRVQVLDSVTLAVLGTIGTAGVSGTDNAHLSGPRGVGFDPLTSHILIADTGNDRIQIFDAKSFAYVFTIGTTGIAASDDAHFSGPTNVRLNSATRQLYVADAGNDRIQVLNADTLAYNTTIGTSGVAGGTNTTFNDPTDAELNPTANEIMVADSGNSRLQRFDARSFAYVGTLGNPTLGSTDNAYLGTPVTATFDATSNLVLVADAGPDNRIQVYDAMSYGYVLTLGSTGTTGTSNSLFSTPSGIVTDPVHSRMFAGDAKNNRVQVYSIGATPIVASVLPGARSVQLTTAATIFASVVNGGTTALSGCQISLPVTAKTGLTLTYQTTNPGTNALIGTANTPAIIAGNNAVQTFVLSFQGSAPFIATDLALDYDCLGTAPAPVMAGVDTVDLTLSTSPIADIIALAATASDNGIAGIPSGGTGAFAVASINFGATSAITASVDTGTATLPLTATICQSNPSTGQCLGAAAPSVTLNFTAGGTPTFSVFVRATGAIPFDPGNSRVFVRFKDGSGGQHGSTSVAVQTG